MSTLCKRKNNSLENHSYHCLSFPHGLLSIQYYDWNSQRPPAYTIGVRHETKEKSTNLISIFPQRLYHRTLVFIVAQW